MTEPKPGDTAICSQCGGQIVYIGPAWDHPGEIKPKHPALPIAAGGSHEIAQAAADLAEMNRLRINEAVLRAVLADLVNQLALLTRDDVTYLWRIGGRPLDEAYKAAKRVVKKGAE
jgi:hypothetical protein